MENKELMSTLVRDDQVDLAIETLNDIVRLLNSSLREDTVTGMRGVIAVAMFKASEAQSRINKMEEMRYM